MGDSTQLVVSSILIHKKQVFTIKLGGFAQNAIWV